MIIALYRIIGLALWFGIMFAICTVIIAAGLLALIVVAAYGLVAPGKTPATALRSLVAKMAAAVDHVKALRPQGQK